MKRSWIVWIMIAGAIITALVIFNGENTKDVSLSDLFPEDTLPADVEYEFVGNEELPVEAAAPVPAPVPSVAQPTNLMPVEGAKIPYTIQVASFKEKSQAEKTLENVSAKNYPAYILSRDLGDKGIWYRVYIGKFDTKLQAEEFLTKVKQDYPDSFIISSK